MLSIPFWATHVDLVTFEPPGYGPCGHVGTALKKIVWSAGTWGNLGLMWIQIWRPYEKSPKREEAIQGLPKGHEEPITHGSQMELLGPWVQIAPFKPTICAWRVKMKQEWKQMVKTWWNPGKALWLVNPFDSLFETRIPASQWKQNLSANLSMNIKSSSKKTHSFFYDF